jgi:hypothetical protein
MNLRAKRQYEMLRRVYAFGADHARQFPADTVGGRMFATVGKCVLDVARHDATRPAGRKGARGAATPRLVARRGLRQRLQAIRRTARALALDTPGFDSRFRLPRGNGSPRLLAAARSVKAAAGESAGEFIAHGLPQTFLEDLATWIEQLDRAMRESRQSRVARRSAATGLRASLEAGFRAVRRLDAVVPNVLDDDPSSMGRWRTARHITRGGRPRRSQTRSAGGSVDRPRVQNHQ